MIDKRKPGYFIGVILILPFGSLFQQPFLYTFIFKNRYPSIYPFLEEPVAVYGII